MRKEIYTPFIKHRIPATPVNRNIPGTFLLRERNKIIKSLMETQTDVLDIMTESNH